VVTWIVCSGPEMRAIANSYRACAGALPQQKLDPAAEHGEWRERVLTAALETATAFVRHVVSVKRRIGVRSVNQVDDVMTFCWPGSRRSCDCGVSAVVPVAIATGRPLWVTPVLAIVRRLPR